jgi:hypothetical protein
MTIGNKIMRKTFLSLACLLVLNGNVFCGPAEDYFNSAGEKTQKGDLEGAMGDLSKAIELKPDFVDAYVNRGLVREDKGDFYGAMTDYSKGQSAPEQPADGQKRASGFKSTENG